MISIKYFGMDVHMESISIAVRNAAGKIVMECLIKTKASMILQFIEGLRGELHVTFEEGTMVAWLYDLLKPRVARVLACNPRRNALLKVTTRMIASTHGNYRNCCAAANCSRCITANMGCGL